MPLTPNQLHDLNEQTALRPSVLGHRIRCGWYVHEIDGSLMAFAEMRSPTQKKMVRKVAWVDDSIASEPDIAKGFLKSIVRNLVTEQLEWGV